ncbi:MAG: FmdE family protein [Candidatus Acidoferrales bacterium]
MKSLEDYIAAAAKNGETRSGIVLGIRMALVGLKELGVEAPSEDRTLVTFIELDRCLPDAIELVTGCRLGNRSLKFVDLGKMAATFVDLKSQRAIRLAARESANQQALEEFAGLEKEEALGRAYREYPDEVLFKKEWVSVALPPEERPGYRGPRRLCSECGEGISFHREVKKGERILCRGCAGESYWKPL